MASCWSEMSANGIIAVRKALVSRYLCNWEKQWGILVVLGQRVQVRATRFRVPDISVLTGLPPDGGIGSDRSPA
jgi:hypothetical protein